MTAAAEKLLCGRRKNFGLLFVVGEERNSAGAAVAAQCPRGSRYLVNGEPTENKLALASKGTLRFELVARADGALGVSGARRIGIEALLDSLDAIRRSPAADKTRCSVTCTMNIGTISGGRAAQRDSDPAKAEILVRLVGDPAPIREAFAAAAGKGVELKEILCIPAIEFVGGNCRRRWYPTPRMCRCSATVGASRCCSGRGVIELKPPEPRGCAGSSPAPGTALNCNVECNLWILQDHKPVYGVSCSFIYDRGTALQATVSR